MHCPTAILLTISQGWKVCPMSSREVLWLCLVWRKKRRLRGVLTALYNFWGGEAERELLVSSPKYPVTGLVGKAQSCAREDLNWVLRSISLPWSWSNTGTSFLERLSKPQAYQSLRGIWTIWLLQDPSNWNSLLYSIPVCSISISVSSISIQTNMYMGGLFIILLLQGLIIFL